MIAGTAAAVAEQMTAGTAVAAALITPKTSVRRILSQK